MKTSPCLLRAGLLALLLSTPALQAAVRVEPAEKGLLVQNGEQLKFTFAYPKLTGADGRQVVKITGHTPTPRGAELTYEQGAEATLLIDRDHIEFHFRNAPDTVKLVGSDTLIHFSFATGGRWQAGPGEPRPFPELQPEKPHLFQGNTNTFAIHDSADKTLRFTLPNHSYVQITDNRAWNWKIFALKFHTPFDPANPVLRIRVSDAAK